MRDHGDKRMEDTSNEHDRFAKQNEHCEDGDDHVEIGGAAVGQLVILCVLCWGTQVNEQLAPW